MSATSALESLIAECTYLQLAFLQAELFARGGIARGGFFADDTFIHGPALDRAVVLEHSRAVYPRTVLDEASVAVAARAFRDEDARARGSPWRRHLAVDQADCVFVSYLAVAIEDPGGVGADATSVVDDHRRVVEACVQRYDGDPPREEKYRWLAGYHNFVVGQARDEYGLDLAGLCVECARPVTGFASFGGAV